MRTSVQSWLLVLCLVFTCAGRAKAIPSDDLLKSLTPAADVNDFAGLLSPEEKDALEARCRLLRERTGAQLSVVTLTSLKGGQIDDFANKLFARWGIGQKNKKNGLLLLVAMEERKSRIEVGYGLEPIIPDVLAGRIIDHQLRPYFRNQQYAAGLTAAANAICELVEKGAPADRAALERNKASQADLLFAVLITTAILAFGAFIFGIGTGLPDAGATQFGFFLAAIPAFIGFLSAGPSVLLLQVPAAIVGAVLGYQLAKGNGNSFGQRSGGNTTGWSWGDYSGSSGGGWSSGGGGFSQSWGGFGGGSSGGGGASGGW